MFNIYIIDNLNSLILEKPEIMTNFYCYNTYFCKL